MAVDAGLTPRRRSFPGDHSDQAGQPAVSAHHGNNYLPLLERYYRSHRCALFPVRETLPVTLREVG
jgi:hypothetical protein